MLIHELKPWRSTYDISGILAGSATGGGLPVTSALFCNDSVQININYVFTNSNFMYVWNIYINL